MAKIDLNLKNKLKLLNATEKYGTEAVANQLKSSGVSSDGTSLQVKNPTTEQLATNISAGTTAPGMSKAQQNYQYNLATDNQQGARDLMLGSKEVLTGGNIKTSISQEEVKNIQDLGINKEDISKNITVDKGVREEMIPNVEKTTVSTPEGTTTTTKETQTETNLITAETQWKDTDKSLGTLEQMVEARYGTVATQNPDGTLSAVIGDKKYQWSMDSAGNPVKTEVQLSLAEKMKAQAISKYMTASSDELYSAMINGNITKEMEQSLMANPNYAIAKEKQSKKLSTDNINSQMEGVYNSMTGKETKEDTTIEDMSNKTVTNLESKGIDVPKFSEYIAKDETLSADVIALNSQIKTIKELKDTAEANTKRITEQYPGISKASAILLSARQNEPLYEQIKALSYDATELQANINYRQSILEEDYKAELAQYQLQEQRAYQEQQTAEERAYNEQQAITNLENQYKYTYGDLDSDNPTLQNIAIERAVGDLYTKYPLPGMESQATKVQKVKNLMAQGMTGSQAIAQVENEIRSSERYKQMINPPQQLTQDWSKLNDTTLYNQKTGEYKSLTGSQSNAMNLGVGSTGGQRTVNINEAYGFYNDTPLAKGGYTDEQIGDLAYLVELQEKNPTQASKDMKELGYSPKDLANYKAGNMPLTEKQKNSSTEIINSIKDLITNYDWNDAVGKFDYSRVIGLQGSEDAKIAIDNLIAKMTLPNLGVLKGPMSDKDIEFIKAASSKLGTTQSNKSFEKNIIDAYNLSARRAGLPEITKLSDISKTPKPTGNTTTGGGQLNIPAKDPLGLFSK